ncbi:MAG: hypothetical protein KDD69_13200, partial [Bdellovibrionales bacterium]|nr:hypothetical protein [Bdellovibrionales bacterium]
FNTSQPSLDPRDQQPVVQWLTLVNLAKEPREFRVRTVQEGGTVLRDLSVVLAPFERADLDGGHGLAGTNSRGVHEVTPVGDERAPFVALLTRYGTTFDPDRFAFAFPSFPRSAAEIALPISTGGGAGAWIELANLDDEPRDVYYSVHDTTGEHSLSSSVPLAAYEHRHFYVPSLIPENSSGTFLYSVRGNVLGQVVSYYYSPTGGIQTAFVSPGEARRKQLQYASYNTFLGMYNWLRLIPYSFPTGPTVQVRAAGTGEVLGAQTVNISPFGVRELDIHNSELWGSVPNSYGLVEVDNVQAYPTVVELLRVRPTVRGALDFIMRTTVE